MTDQPSNRPRVGQPAPPFELAAADGRKVRLADLRGRPTVLYFYPKSFTSGCTAQACGLRDAYSDLRNRRIAVVGISHGNAETQRRFAEAYRLPFDVLADPEGETARAYGVWEPLEAAERRGGKVRRATFILDERGIIVGIIDPAHAESHLSEVEEALTAAASALEGAAARSDRRG